MTDIHTIHRQLTQWHVNRQPYRHETNGTTWDTAHITNVPPLITQLDGADKRPAELDLGGTHPTSKPTANLEALDTLIHIDNEAARWVRQLGHDDPGDTAACVTKLYSLAASAQFCRRDKPTIEDREAICCDVHRIERAMRRWWTQARIASGWDSSPWKPNNTCPACNERRSLRIRLDDQAGFCTNCRETWDSASIGILAEHVRTENAEEELTA